MLPSLSTGTLCLLLACLLACLLAKGLPFDRSTSNTAAKQTDCWGRACDLFDFQALRGHACRGTNAGTIWSVHARAGLAPGSALVAYCGADGDVAVCSLPPETRDRKAHIPVACARASTLWSLALLGHGATQTKW